MNLSQISNQTKFYRIKSNLNKFDSIRLMLSPSGGFCFEVE